MAIDLTTIFGSEIKVYAQPRIADRQYVGFPGAHGLAGMFLGTRGSQLIITGRLARTGNDYSAARSNLQAAIDTIESYTWADAADYSFFGDTYQNVVFEKFQLIPNSNGKAFYWTSEGYVIADFVMYARLLI